MPLFLRGFLIVLSTLFLGVLLWTGSLFLPYPFYLVSSYAIFAFFLLFAAFFKSKEKKFLEKLFPWEALILFLLIMSIRLPSYALSGILLEKLPAIFLVLLWALWIKGWSASSLGLSLKKFPKQILLGLGFALLYWILYQATFALYTWTNSGVWAFSLFNYPQDVPRGIPLDPVSFLIALFLYSNFAEELFFRGFLLKEVHEGRRKPLPFFLFQASLFSLYHVNYALFPGQGKGVDWPYLGFYLIWTFLFGIGFGFAYLISESVISTTILHVLGNIMQSNWILLFYPLSQKGKPYPQESALAFRESIVRPALILDALIFALVLGAIWFAGKRARGTIRSVNAAPR
jgi:membrane protease YdiL (CAAX protease family)